MGTARARRIKPLKSLTLIELLVSIAIAILIVGVTTFMLKTSVDTYSFAQTEAFLQQVLRQSMDELTDGTDDFYGIRDSLEIIAASSDKIVFTPPFIDGPYDASADGEYELSIPVQPGAGTPIGEIQNESKADFLPAPVTFIHGQHPKISKVIFNEALPIGSRVHFIYQPEAQEHREVTEEITWNKPARQLKVTYNKKSGVIPRYVNPYVRLENVLFEFYDNTNAKIEPEASRKEVAASQLPLITAVKITVRAQIRSKTGRLIAQKSLPVFINIRNTRNSGTGIIIRQDSQFKIPDSHHIRTFAIGNIMGVEEGDIIELQAQPEQGTDWRIRLIMGINEQGLAVIKRYQVEYPPGRVVFAETINHTVDLGLNFLTLGGSGRYDYKYDKNTSNFVELKGNVLLTIKRMDVDGAALFIRP